MNLISPHKFFTHFIKKTILLYEPPTFKLFCSKIPPVNFSTKLASSAEYMNSGQADPTRLSGATSWSIRPALTLTSLLFLNCFNPNPPFRQISAITILAIVGALLASYHSQTT